ncbi:MAG TPA: hypothetical protein P5052_03100 [Candidatus Paceibacterota bacterium]|jgi:hypothetical protein|nr:hypothetical protein [Candidatus Paceibacterota bacterium]HRZ29716.1 hypothetical protein [Candidatus Paceibacterota bacterium]
MNQPIFKIINPNANLYDRIIYAIQKEKETQKIKKLMILFITMFCFSCSFTVASIVLFVKSFKNSGISDIVSTAFYDLSAFIFL